MLGTTILFPRTYSLRSTGKYEPPCPSPHVKQYIRARHDPRTRNDRIHAQNLAWAAQLNDLTLAYMEYKAGTTNNLTDAGGNVLMEIISITLHSKSWFSKRTVPTPQQEGKRSHITTTPQTTPTPPFYATASSVPPPPSRPSQSTFQYWTITDNSIASVPDSVSRPRSKRCAIYMV